MIQQYKHFKYLIWGDFLTNDEPQQWRMQDFHGMEVTTIGVGVPTHNFAKFSQKMHEIERI